ICLITAGLLALVLGLDLANDLGWDAPLTLGLLIGCLPLLALFIFVERRMLLPLVRLDLFKSSRFFGAVFLGFIIQFVIMGVMLFTPMYLQKVHGLPVFTAGLFILPLTVGVVIASLPAGRITDRYGPRLPLILGPTIAALTLFLIGLLSSG